MDPLFSVQKKSDFSNLLENPEGLLSIGSSGLVAFSTCINLLSGKFWELKL